MEVPSTEAGFNVWLAAYVEKYHQAPSTAEHLCAFVRNQGGHLMFRLAREKLTVPSLHRFISENKPPKLQRVRSDKAEVKVKIKTSKLAHLILTDCYRKVAEQYERNTEHLALFGLNGLLPELAKKEDCCAICMEPTPCIQTAGDLCRERECKGWFCVPCLEKHVATIIEDTRFSVPNIRCPSCFGFVPPCSWQRFTDQGKWGENAADLLSLRCGDCDEPGSLLEVGEKDSSARKRLVKKAFHEEDGRALVEQWRLFERGSLNASQLIIDLIALWKQELNESEEPAESLRERFQAAMRLVEDDGLRAVLQLAMLRLFPKTRTPCCESPHCFRCKVQGHHEDQTCEEVMEGQAPENGVQFCPGCGVATVRTEGCNHIICLCGESWQWDGEED